jgi:DNA-binding response OmpR family regulator
MTQLSPRTQPQGSGAAYRILIVDDADLLRMGLVRWLTGIGYTVDDAATGREALSRLALASFDLVVLDLHLPDMEGETLCRQIRQHYGLPVVMLSNINLVEASVKALAAGASCFVGKPFSLREIQTAIHETFTHHVPERPKLTNL